ncbi:uncharacterized protein LOC124113184 isoform X1 [Haliotis rufescens]|uniref:uncharacterized protein LOC124113184 isoform X1 n=1 Tax=Haliotis rufescens TaxID=6454 RepID=UPI00201F7E6D|nr:uncharacterized protein LOC124113184 isoform X1 [Haliotis rufescens]XP_046329411.2 uncharacterized protein LOC124113184 isoform X1 [Haliotis rufescens]
MDVTKDESPPSVIAVSHHDTDDVQGASGGGETGETPHDLHSNPSGASRFSVSHSGESRENSETGNKRDLSVCSKWKVTERLNEKMLASRKPSLLAPIAKWIWTLLLGLLLLACLSASKLSVVGLAERLNNSTRGAISASTRDGRIEAIRVFLMIAMILLVPYCFNLLRALFLATFRNDMPWPSSKSLIIGVAVAVMEAFGLCLFALKVLVKHKGYLAILLMNAVFVVPFLVKTVFYATNRRQHRRGKWIFDHVLGGIFQITGFGLVVFLVSEQDSGDIWHVFVALVCLTVAWVPHIQQLTVNPTRRPDETSDGTGNGVEDTETSVAGGGGQSTNPTTQVVITTWKMAMISNFVKVVSVLIFSYILFFIDGNVYTTDTSEEFLEAWRFIVNSDFNYFLTNIITVLVGYFVSVLACQTGLQKWAFAVPICVTGPLFLVVMLVKDWCTFVMPFSPGACVDDYSKVWAMIAATACFFLAHLLSATLPIFRSKSTILQKESSIFWLPSYNGVLLEQWLMLNMQTRPREQLRPGPHKSHTKSQVYICTTMYRENEVEMRQLLQSINQINLARADDDKFFESHVLFDSGIQKKTISEFPLQLLTLIEETLGIMTDNCTKVETPYGMKLSWNLPQPSSKVRPMTFNIHLKDGRKVRNKKRWSQIMYMSYVVDFLMTSNDEDCYILTTDADVKFTPDSVEALLDLMTRDRSVGAVCARTHPIGSGPLVWYQVFEYAIRHWFQKAAEHVLGSVLCAPGCFSVYRCVALKEILTVYSTNVEHAFDFLTKDMGEDRWLCTLMVQSGWRIEYCAAAENSTHCPSEFEEFYKQRRRWIASSIGNLMLLIKQWQIIRLFNYRVSLLYIVYQGALLFSTLIGPSTVILIVSGGLWFACGVGTWVSGYLQLSLCASFIFICLYTSDKTQILTAKLLTVIYAMVMTALVVGATIQIADNFNQLKSDDGTGFQVSTENLFVSDNGSGIPHSVKSFLGSSTSVSPTTIYLSSIASVFIVAALLHPKEMLCLIYGICYLPCLPSGYLLLMIYSVCNITDRSWGTREKKSYGEDQGKPGYKRLQKIMEIICFCCVKRPTPADKSLVIEVPPFEKWASSEDLKPGSSSERRSVDDDDDDDDDDEVYIPIPVEEWLPPELREHGSLFRQHGFHTTLFISGMTESELDDIGIKGKGPRQNLLQMIESLPAFEIDYKVPSSVIEWLETIGLSEYEQNFKRNNIKKTKDLSLLKSFRRKEIEKKLKITMTGHIKRLIYAIQKLRQPTKAEKKAAEMKALVDRSPTRLLRNSNIAEYDFWQRLIDECLEPDSKAFGIEAELNARLGELRNTWLMILVVSNLMWLILIITLPQLTVLGTSPLVLSLLLIFGTLLGIQFLAMLAHRLSTLVHFMARAPFKCGAPMKTSWSFEGQRCCHDHETQDDVEAIRTIRNDEANIHESRRRQLIRNSSSGSISETAPLISHSQERELKTPPFL